MATNNINKLPAHKGNAFGGTVEPAEQQKAKSKSKPGNNSTGKEG